MTDSKLTILQHALDGSLQWVYITVVIFAVISLLLILRIPRGKGFFMTTTELEIIKALAEEGNMRKAAERLFLSQPAFPNDCRTLKRSGELCCSSVHRKGMEPTPAGELVIAFARETILKKEETVEMIASMADKVHGTLKIACASIIGQTWLPQVLKEFVRCTLMRKSH